MLVGGEEHVPEAFIFVWENFFRPKPRVLSAECFFGLIKYCVLCILCLSFFVRAGEQLSHYGIPCNDVRASASVAQSTGDVTTPFTYVHSHRNVDAFCFGKS